MRAFRSRRAFPKAKTFCSTAGAASCSQPDAPDRLFKSALLPPESGAILVLVLFTPCKIHADDLELRMTMKRMQYAANVDLLVILAARIENRAGGIEGDVSGLVLLLQTSAA